jgi:hypothetical protein
MLLNELTNNSLIMENLYIDIPNEHWLNDNIERAKQNGRDRFGVPYLGKITAYVKNEEVRIPLSILRKIPGSRGEQKNVRLEDLNAIMNIMKETGKLPTHDGKEYKPLIFVAWNGEAWVSEGNHRIMAADKLGWSELPVELRYFDGGERVKSGPLYPEKIMNK